MKGEVKESAWKNKKENLKLKEYEWKVKEAQGENERKMKKSRENEIMLKWKVEGKA